MKGVPSHTHHHQAMRLRGYDYTLSGAYFVTLVSWKRACIFGEVIDGVMQQNSLGKLIQLEWNHIPYQFPKVKLDSQIIMSNHFHGIIVIEDKYVGATRLQTHSDRSMEKIGNDQVVEASRGLPKDINDRPNGPAPDSLGAIIGQLKSRITKRYWGLPGVERDSIWQPNYYDHIIRNEHQYNQIIQYIETNPLHWEEDQYHMK
jgi:REP element-mobilizing transposase RayT